MTVKTDISRFHIHDELTAPEGSVKILKSVQGAAGSISKFIGVLAGAPAALRAYARMRHELRGGSLPPATRERIGLAVAARRGDPYSIAQHAAEEAREQDWTDEELLEAVAHLAMNEFQSLIANAAALPHDQTDSSVL